MIVYDDSVPDRRRTPRRQTDHAEAVALVLVWVCVALALALALVCGVA